MISIIMAIWYGVRAHRFGRYWFGWAVLGFLIPDVTFTVALYTLGFLFSGGTMELEAEAVQVIVFGGIATAVLVGLVVGFKVLKPREQRRPEDGIRFLDCPSCGVRNLAAAGTCTLCGARLGEYASPLQETAVTRSEPERPDSADKSADEEE
jgi:hypothetical protein